MASPCRLATTDLGVEVSTVADPPGLPGRRGRVAPPGAAGRRDGGGAVPGWPDARPRALRLQRRAALLRARPGRRPARPARREPAALEHAPRPRPGLGHGRAAPRLEPRVRGVLRQHERRPADGGALGQRRAHRLRGGVRAAHLVLPDRPGSPRGDGRGRGAARPRPDAPALGARVPPVHAGTSTTRPSCASCRAPSGTSASPATASSISRRTARRTGGTAGSGTSSSSRSSGRIPPASSGRPGPSTSSSSPTSTRCSTRTPRCSPRRSRAATS